MKTIAKIKYVLFLIVIAGFVSCKGEIGPPGADGIDGIAGTNGTDGTDGTDGEDGNANVISSDVITPGWTGMPATSGEFGYTTTDITTEVMTTGLVLSYINWWDYINGDYSDVYPLPYTISGADYYFRLSDEKITWGFNAETAVTPWGNIRFRYVIIPSSGTKSAGSKQAIYDELDNAGVDINDYYEVMDYYGLDY